MKKEKYVDNIHKFFLSTRFISSSINVHRETELKIVNSYDLYISSSLRKSIAC